jgi:hypothetical protein
MARFNRVYSLQVGTKGSPQAVTISGLRVTFNIEKTITPYPNRSNIKVYNLTPEHREEFEKTDTLIALSAGYLEESGPVLLFSGNVTYAFSEYATEQGDVVTTFELGDGHVALRDSMCSLSCPAGASAAKLVNTIATQMGLSLYMDKTIVDKVWSSGFSFYGSGRAALEKVAAAAGWQWSIQNGALQIVPRGQTTKRQIITLDATSGLLGYPKRERKLPPQAHQRADGSAPSIRHVTLSPRRRIDGWRVKSFLLPELNPGDPINLQSRTIKGEFRVERLQHFGDSDGGDWVTESYIGKTAQNG